MDLQQFAHQRKPPRNHRPAQTFKRSLSPKKQRRGYAPPEQYSHLKSLPDRLASGLDVVFCGINPGVMSAQIGFHFGNPNNHFWRCLHQSGLTPRQLRPQEGTDLPRLYGLGLTDLIERPTADATELSDAEMVAAVPSLLSKLASYQPRIVAFVGLKIAKIITAGAAKLGNFNPDAKIPPGLLPYKLIYLDGDKETLFYALPSTSGRVTQYTLKDKIALFAELKDHADRVKEGSLDTSALHKLSMADSNISSTSQDGSPSHS